MSECVRFCGAGDRHGLPPGLSEDAGGICHRRRFDLGCAVLCITDGLQSTDSFNMWAIWSESESVYDCA